MQGLLKVRADNNLNHKACRVRQEKRFPFVIFAPSRFVSKHETELDFAQALDCNEFHLARTINFLYACFIGMKQHRSE
jgi:hypothetical protein